MAETIKGAIAPEKPLSLQHWVDSAVTFSLLIPGSKFVADEGGTLISL